MEKGNEAMVTDSAHHHSAAATIRGLLARVGGQVRQLICGLHGHDSLLHFQQGRLSLLCSSCGYETPGWNVHGEAVVQEQTVAVEPKRRALRMPVLSIRRIA
jgi:hypothetical protein